MHATEFLKQPEKHANAAVAVLYGAETHLRAQSLKKLVTVLCGADNDDADLGLTRFAGKDADYKSVADELLTVSMFGDQRVVVIEDADDFVSKNRPALEKYVERPAKKATLVLDVKSWPKNTKLAKKVVAKRGLVLECSELSGAKLTKWITERVTTEFEKQISRDAAASMVELAGTSLGLLQQEIDKLVSYVGERDRITPEDVRTLVGGWRAETTWTMLNAVRDAKIGMALDCLDKLLIAGEAPQKILGGINFVFRKFSAATEISRNGVPLSSAMKQAGIFPRDASAGERYLRRMTRPRAERILHRLAKADGDMKGNSRVPPRQQLEQLLVALSGV